MQKSKAIVGIAASFTALVVVVISLLIERIVSFELAMLILIALLGLYFGFGALIVIYRFVSKLD